MFIKFIAVHVGTTYERLSEKMNKTPCKDCLKRHIGCHAICSDYLDFWRANEERKRKQYNEIDKGNLIMKRYKVSKEKWLKRGLK